MGTTDLSWEGFAIDKGKIVGSRNSDPSNVTTGGAASSVLERIKTNIDEDPITIDDGADAGTKRKRLPHPSRFSTDGYHGPKLGRLRH